MKSFKDIIADGGVAVIRTDTLYGIVCDAHNPHAVDRIYKIKQRDLLKPVIVLVAHFEQIAEFGITLNPETQAQLKKYWPGKVSIVLPATDTSVNTHYIHKGTGGIAFRIPADAELRKLLIESGPLIAPSANPEGKPPAKNIDEARDYFKDQVDYYMDGGEVVESKASQMIKIDTDGNVIVLRK